MEIDDFLKSHWARGLAAAIALVVGVMAFAWPAVTITLLVVGLALGAVALAIYAGLQGARTLGQASVRHPDEPADRDYRITMAGEARTEAEIEGERPAGRR
jgi:hypothetical protein